MKQLDKGFYSGKTFLNSVTALDIAIENHYGDMLFDGDLSRIIYSSNEQALRNRAKNEKWSNAHLPFMNYKLTDLQKNSSEREYWNAALNMYGIYLDEVGQYAHVTPVLANYEATVFMHRFDETQFALQKVLWDNDNETILTAQVAAGNPEGSIIDVPAILSYDISYNPQYNESDWLERNNIYTIDMSLEFVLWIIDMDDDVWVPEEVVFNFASKKNIDTEETTYEEIIQFAK